ncbi:MoaD/ThiS family protein [Marinimicrobium agarilyticum]|uniref:MoaD/ThiS family protein n=1 Tax=Marinimicrobium agarilyticum TaxID=306546 RepID=UPI000480C359|nr:MoaD/ThiS family protein [Marinimicrobium agarilyticum]
MPTIKMTSHLYRFFPHLKNRTLSTPPGSVAEVLSAINDQAPGFTDYILDEQGALRRHVKVCINDTIVIDRKGLSDLVQDGDTVFIFQALSGG